MLLIMMLRILINNGRILFRLGINNVVIILLMIMRLLLLFILISIIMIVGLAIGIAAIL